MKIELREGAYPPIRVVDVLECLREKFIVFVCRSEESIGEIHITDYLGRNKSQNV